jgi:hypothetical protein
MQMRPRKPPGTRCIRFIVSDPLQIKFLSCFSSYANICQRRYSTNAPFMKEVVFTPLIGDNNLEILTLSSAQN